MELHELVGTSGAVRGTASRLEKTALLAGLLHRLAPEEVPVAVGFLTGWPRQGRVGVGWATAGTARPQASASRGCWSTSAH